ncbi:MAG: hypothetical protein Q9225_005783 [Loekoesia sp. 1 TL-2023]
MAPFHLSFLFPFLLSTLIIPATAAPARAITTAPNPSDGTDVSWIPEEENENTQVLEPYQAYHGVWTSNTPDGQKKHESREGGDGYEDDEGDSGVTEGDDSWGSALPYPAFPPSRELDAKDAPATEKREDGDDGDDEDDGDSDYDDAASIFAGIPFPPSPEQRAANAPATEKRDDDDDGDDDDSDYNDAASIIAGIPFPPSSKEKGAADSSNMEKRDDESGKTHGVWSDDGEGGMRWVPEARTEIEKREVRDIDGRNDNAFDPDKLVRIVKEYGANGEPERETIRRRY